MPALSIIGSGCIIASPSASSEALRLERRCRDPITMSASSWAPLSNVAWFCRVCGLVDARPQVRNTGRMPPGTPGEPGFRAFRQDPDGNFLVTTCAHCELVADVRTVMYGAQSLRVARRDLAQALLKHQNRVLGPPPPPPFVPATGAVGPPPPPP